MAQPDELKGSHSPAHEGSRASQPKDASSGTLTQSSASSSTSSGSASEQLASSGRKRKHTPADTTTSGSGADSDSGSEASVGAALPAQLITVQQRLGDLRESQSQLRQEVAQAAEMHRRLRQRVALTCQLWELSVQGSANLPPGIKALSPQEARESLVELRELLTRCGVPEVFK